MFDAFTLLICEKNVTNHALLWYKTCSLKIWLCKILDKYHVWPDPDLFQDFWLTLVRSWSRTFLFCSRKLLKVSGMHQTWIIFGLRTGVWQAWIGAGKSSWWKIWPKQTWRPLPGLCLRNWIIHNHLLFQIPSPDKEPNTVLDVQKVNT